MKPGGGICIKQTKDELLIAALIACPTIKEAAAQAGIGETTAHKRLNDPEFQKKYRAACVDLLGAHTATMQIAMGEAIATLREIIKNPEAASGVRASAADTVLRNAMKLTETVNILERIAALEAAQRGDP